MVLRPRCLKISRVTKLETKSTLDVFLQGVKEEREYQDSRWGTEFDDKNTVNDWVMYIVKYASNASCMPANDDAAMKAFKKVAALSAAAVESCVRNGGFPKRHYD